MDSKTFEILLKRGALETPKRSLKSNRSRKNIKRKKTKSQNNPPVGKVKSRKIHSPPAKIWTELGRNVGITASLLTTAASENVYEYQKLKRHVYKYEAELATCLQRINRVIINAPKTDSNFFKIDEVIWDSSKRHKIGVKPTKYFLKRDTLAKIFRSIEIRGNGNCLFNSFAWWIITYYSLTNVSFGDIDQNLARVIPKIAANIHPLNATDPDKILEIADLLRSLVCGFYDVYQVSEKDLRGTDLRLVSLADLNSHIGILKIEDANHTTKICQNAEWGTDVDARVLGYIFRVNIVFVLTEQHGNQHCYSAEYGELGRPTFYIFKSTGHYDVLYPTSHVFANSIAPLPII